MRREIILGAMAGAVGIVALDAVSYLDMAVRGRPASELPSRLVDRVAEAAGFDVPKDDPSWRNRASAIGALLGYAVGVGTGAVYGAVRARWAGPPRPVAAVAVGAVAVGAAAMALSDVPLVLSGLTDPRTWGLSGWTSDIVPHLAYGLAAVLAFDAVRGFGPPGRRPKGR
ncbi:hypothetical protein [Actinomadura sp. HBU206391]|uniref:hypothetical protein n=1 Tax=Actinomadura sp. HBU206391 TaxID=2731692 RepID=UPI001650D0F0|nr:hypothetical protein [Actinomadura sp. HBU206391]MBC6460640.1 hypothetical protein [Actinomadura sp. HBU206391]